MTNKLEQYSKKYQGFLEYSPDKKINAILLDSYFETKYNIKFNDKHFETRTLSKELANFLESDGGKIEKIQIKRTHGKKKLFGLSVKIKKIKNNDSIEGIRIKLMGNNFDSISKKVELIKEKMSEYGIKPKECIRERKDLEEGIDEEDNDDTDNDDTDDEIIEDTILEVPHMEKSTTAP